MRWMIYGFSLFLLIGSVGAGTIAFLLYRDFHYQASYLVAQIFVPLFRRRRGRHRLGMSLQHAKSS